MFAGRRIGKWWASQSAFRRHVLINIALGAAIDAAIHLFHDLPVVQRAENAGIDRTIAFFGTRGSDQLTRPGLAFTVLDIDEGSWRAWGSPNVTPRGKILRLLELATGAKAALVVVDLDLSRRENENGRAAAPGDSALARFLAHYRDPTPIVLVRSLSDSVVDGEPRPMLPRPAPAWFEPLADDATPNVHWGTARYVREPDGVLRRWRLWEPVCQAGQPAMLPSIQLMVAALADPPDGPARLDRLMDRLTPSSCNDSDEANEKDDDRATAEVFWDHRIAAGDETLPQRLIYSLRWPPERGPTRQVLLPAGDTVPMLTRLSARDLTDARQPIHRGALAGRIVVIGGSYADSRDWHSTPLGDMPGMMVVVNAIASLREHGQLHKSEGPLFLLVTGGLIVLASFAYARYHPLVATTVMLPIIYLLVAPLSFFVFRTSAWLDFTAPLLATQLHELIAHAESAWSQRGRRPHAGPEPGPGEA